MGQRSQIILIVESCRYDKDNANSHEGEIWISHNQWRYGYNFIYVLRHLLDKFNKIKEEDLYHEKVDGKVLKSLSPYFFSSADRIFYDCLLYAENHDINFTLSNSNRFENVTERVKDSFDFIDFLQKNTDNNNGWAIIKLCNNGSIKLAIVNGSEDGEIKRRTFKGYGLLFGKPDDIDRENLEILNQYGKIGDLDEEFLRIKLRNVKNQNERW